MWWPGVGTNGLGSYFPCLLPEVSHSARSTRSLSAFCCRILWRSLKLVDMETVTVRLSSPVAPFRVI